MNKLESMKHNVKLWAKRLGVEMSKGKTLDVRLEYYSDLTGSRVGGLAVVLVDIINTKSSGIIEPLARRDMALEIARAVYGEDHNKPSDLFNSGVFDAVHTLATIARNSSANSSKPNIANAVLRKLHH